VTTPIPGFLPHVLVYDPSAGGRLPQRPASHRNVVDQLKAMVTTARVATDGVESHTDLLDEFLCLGAPHAERVITQ